MINSQYFEIPDFCATHTRQGGACNDCLAIFEDPNCVNHFGLSCDPNNTATCTCHDICVQEVRLIGTTEGNCEFTQCFNYPPIGPCRLGSGITLPIIDINHPCKVFVVCAEETLDQPTCQTINATVRILIFCHTMTNGVVGNILIPLDINVSFDTFYRFPECTLVTGNDLQDALTDIDGSCLVIQLKAQARLVGNFTQLVVSGKIIDKLWKHENLWVTGIRPYDLTAAQKNDGFVSFTVEDVFKEGHKIGNCASIPCP